LCADARNGHRVEATLHRPCPAQAGCRRSAFPQSLRRACPSQARDQRRDAMRNAMDFDTFFRRAFGATDVIRPRPFTYL